MPVRINFPRKRNGALKRWKRDLSDAQSRIRVLEQEREKLLTKVKTTQKKFQRMKMSPASSAGTNDAELTPRKETEEMMNEAGLNDSQKIKIRKHLLTGNVLTKQIAEARRVTPRGRMKELHNLVAGHIVKRYECLRKVNARTGLCRRALGKMEDKTSIHDIRKRRSKLLTIEKNVINFLKREDNSRALPGKKDAKRIKHGQKMQTYALTDYLKNLHLKFLAENPASDISLTTFIRCRPVYILKSAFTSRICCLCTKHQNAAFTVKTLKNIGVELLSNPEKAVKDIPSSDALAEKIIEDVKLCQWKRIEVEERGRKKYVTRIVEETLTPEKMIEHTEKQMKEFKGHVERMTNQYEQLKKIKLNLPEHHIIVQLDFAENYSCRSVEEVQSAYFNKTSVTLHPCVVYYQSADNELKHKSFITVSDETSHKASTVIAFIEDLMPELKKIDANLTCIHYWSDSPSSQYRNKLIFRFVQEHSVIFKGIKAVWNYFESGHGKGPCDGLGGTCKRMADEATRCGKYVIQDARSFYNWALMSSMTNVNFRFVGAEVCESKYRELEGLSVMPVKGTMKVHAVAEREKGILLNTISCYCEDKCLGGNYCGEWTKTSTKTKHSGQDQNRRESEDLSTMEHTTNHTEHIDPEFQMTDETRIEKDDYVAVMYQREIYIGCVIDKDDEEFDN